MKTPEKKKTKKKDSRANRYERAPTNRWFGFRFKRVGKGRAEVSLPVRGNFLQVEGVVHGGVLATLADTAATYAVFPTLAEGETMTSIEFKLNFLAPAREGTLVAKARTVKRGRSIALVDCDILSGGKPVAKGLFTYFVWTPKKAE